MQALCGRLSDCGDLAGQDVELAGRTVAVNKSADAPVPKSWGSIAMIPVLDDAVESARGLFKLRKPNSKSTICTVSNSSTSACTHLSDGVLKLRAESCITFDHSCAALTLSNITVKGVLPNAHAAVTRGIAMMSRSQVAREVCCCIGMTCTGSVSVIRR